MELIGAEKWHLRHIFIDLPIRNCASDIFCIMLAEFVLITREAKESETLELLFIFAKASF